MADKFKQPIAVMVAPHSITEADYDEPIYQEEAHGIGYRYIRPQVICENGFRIGAVGTVYKLDLTQKAKLEGLARSYNLMREALQMEWDRVLNACEKVGN